MSSKELGEKSVFAKGTTSADGSEGLTFREYIATQCMASITPLGLDMVCPVMEARAKLAVQAADALLAALNKTS